MGLNNEHQKPHVPKIRFKKSYPIHIPKFLYIQFKTNNNVSDNNTENSVKTTCALLRK